MRECVVDKKRAMKRDYEDAGFKKKPRLNTAWRQGLAERFKVHEDRWVVDKRDCGVRKYYF